jgi:AcrR family transcriptional regulator
MKVDPHIRRSRSARLSREQRIADLMRIARGVFRARGFDDGVIAEIAASAGVVEGTIYRYFPTKRDLLIEVMEDWYEEMLADYDQHLKGIAGTRNRLRFMIWRHLTVMHEEPVLCRLMMGEVRADADYRRTAVYDLNRRYTQRTIAIIKEGIASGEFRADVPVTIVRDMIYGGIEHHCWAYLRGEGDFSPERAADEIVAIVYRGLAADSAASTDLQLARLEAVAARLETASSRKGKA